jgi:hypothetical protein
MEGGWETGRRRIHVCHMRRRIHRKTGRERRTACEKNTFIKNTFIKNTFIRSVLVDLFCSYNRSLLTVHSVSFDRRFLLCLALNFFFCTHMYTHSLTCATTHIHTRTHLHIALSLFLVLFLFLFLFLFHSLSFSLFLSLSLSRIHTHIHSRT